MQTYSFWLYEELLPYIGHGKQDRMMFSTTQGSYVVTVNSTKLELFKRNPKCVGCRLHGQIWILESHGSLHESREARPHLNLYALTRNDSLVLMTRDHIYPRSAGGSDGLTNLQTMCSNCNQKKGNALPDVRDSDRDIGAVVERSLRKQRLRALSTYADFLALTQERPAQ